MDANVITTLATVLPTLVVLGGLLLRLGGLILRLERRMDQLEFRLERTEHHLEQGLERAEGHLEQRLEAHGSRIDGLALAISSLNQQLASLFAIFSGLLASLHKAGSLPDEDYRRTSQQLAVSLSQTTAPYVESLTTQANPITREQGARFRELVSMARHGHFFTAPEAREYNYILKLIREDRGDDPQIWPLVALGNYLFGMYPTETSEE